MHPKQEPGLSSLTFHALFFLVHARPRTRNTLPSLAVANLEDLAERGDKARRMIVEAGLPDDVRQVVEDSYDALCEENGGVQVSVAVRSSATAEDLPTASFAGQQSSFLNVVGKERVANAVLECLASIFTDRAITYRVHNKFDHMAVKVTTKPPPLV